MAPKILTEAKVLRIPQHELIGELMGRGLSTDGTLLEMRARLSCALKPKAPVCEEARVPDPSLCASSSCVGPSAPIVLAQTSAAPSVECRSRDLPSSEMDDERANVATASAAVVSTPPDVSRGQAHPARPDQMAKLGPAVAPPSTSMESSAVVRLPDPPVVGSLASGSEAAQRVELEDQMFERFAAHPECQYDNIATGMPASWLTIGSHPRLGRVLGCLICKALPVDKLRPKDRTPFVCQTYKVGCHPRNGTPCFMPRP